MKIRSIYAVGAAATLALSLTACGDSEEDTATPSETTASETTEAEDMDEAEDTTEEQPDDAAAGGEGELTEEDGVLVDTDLQANILEGSGIEVTVDEEAEMVAFELLDPETGESYSNTFEFDYANGEYRHHKYVSAMGATFDYTMDLESNEIESIIDSDGEEGIESVTQQGRLEIAQADRDSERQELESYFEDRYGMTVEEAVTGA